MDLKPGSYYNLEIDESEGFVTEFRNLQYIGVVVYEDDPSPRHAFHSADPGAEDRVTLEFYGEQIRSATEIG